jgi:protein-S-isoprenylcysteine O-methyltransferase Ste14
MKLITRAIAAIIIYPIILMGFMFGLGGDWGWLKGWRFIILLMGLVMVVMVTLMRHKKLLEERFKKPYQKGQDLNDKVIMTLIGLFYILWLAIMPLDASRYKWSPEFPLFFTIVGVLGFLISMIMLSAVFRENAFLAKVVKKQKNQKVVSTGLYAYVRHPMYLASIIMFLSGAFVLGSLYGIYISIILAIIFYIRTGFEEKKLEKELKGYKEYKKKVKYKLIPGVV